MDKIIRVLKESFPGMSANAYKELAKVVGEMKPITPEQRLAERKTLMREHPPLESYFRKVCKQLFGHNDLDKISASDLTEFLEATSFELHWYLLCKKHGAGEASYD